MEIKDKDKAKLYAELALPVIKANTSSVLAGMALADYETKVVMAAFYDAARAYKMYRKRVVKALKRKPWPRKRNRRFHQMRVGA